MEELHNLSMLLIERETIDKDQFERLLAGEAPETVFPEAEKPAAEAGEPETKPRAEPKPRPFPLPGATMQPPPEPEGAN
jgi:cell division protease FtsH